MTERFSQIIRNGWRIWKENLILCAPFIIRIVILIALILPLSIAFIFIYGVGSGSSNTSESSNSTTLFILAIIYIISLGLIYSFFQAGAIEMSKEAIEKGTTHLDLMWSAGKKKCIDMFFSYLLIFLIVLIVAIIAGLLFFPGMNAPKLDGPLFWLELMIVFVILLLVTLGTALIPYALVIDDLGPVEAVKASIGFFRANPLDIFSIFIAIFLVSLIVGIVSLPLSILPIVGSLVSTFISQVVIASLSTLWFTRLYLSGTGKLPVDVEK